jgi:hypothetical protein
MKKPSPPSLWRPAFQSRRTFLGNPGEKEERLGVAVLTALSIAGLHSAVCPSYFTMVTFGSQPEAKERAMDGLWISLGLSTLASVAIYGVWKDLPAALVGQATALALFGIGVYAIGKEAPATIPPIDKQNTTSVPGPAPARQVMNA